MATSEISTCIDKKIGNSLKLLDYVFKGVSPERKKVFESHLRLCPYCQNERKKMFARKRKQGLFMVGASVALIIVGLLILVTLNIPLGSSGLSITSSGLLFAGIGLFFRGLWQLLRGKSSEQK